MATGLGLMAMALCAAVLVTAARADDTAPAALKIGYLGQSVKRLPAQPYFDPPPTDEGLQGARLGIADNNTTGHFTGQRFELAEAVVPENGDIPAAFRKLLADGVKLVVTNLPADPLMALATLPEAAPGMGDITLFDAGTSDDSLRAERCRANVLHLLPSRAMLADALVQYLIAKQWRNLFLVVGPSAADRAYADAVKRAIQKFHARLVEEKPWTFQPGARRSDTGHYSIEAEVARFTQGVSYDVLVVADEEDAFGDDIQYRSFDPRLVAGTQGLIATAWARPHQEWGATQLQNRFLRQAQRWMTDRDYAAWMAVRAIGEAATRSSSTDPATLMRFMRSDKFELAAFKGSRLNFRDWDGQLRQPVLLVDALSLVSVSPQQGFLHQFSELDTLGIDRPETRCHMP